MAKFEKILQENGLSYDSVSSAIKNKIDEFKENELVVKSIKQGISNAKSENDEEAISELESDLNEMVGVQDVLEKELIKNINNFVKGKKLGESRKKKVEGKTEEKAQPQSQAQPQPQSQAQPQPQPQAQIQPQPQPYKVEEEKEEKKGGGLGWVLGGLLLVLSAGMVYKFAKK